MDTSDKKIEELRKKMNEDVDNMEEIDKANYNFEIGKIKNEK